MNSEVTEQDINDILLADVVEKTAPQSPPISEPTFVPPKEVVEIPNLEVSDTLPLNEPKIQQKNSLFDESFGQIDETNIAQFPKNINPKVQDFQNIDSDFTRENEVSTLNQTDGDFSTIQVSPSVIPAKPEGRNIMPPLASNTETPSKVDDDENDILEQIQSIKSTKTTSKIKSTNESTSTIQPTTEKATETATSTESISTATSTEPISTEQISTESTKIEKPSVLPSQLEVFRIHPSVRLDPLPINPGPIIENDETPDQETKSQAKFVKQITKNLESKDHSEMMIKLQKEKKECEKDEEKWWSGRECRQKVFECKKTMKSSAMIIGTEDACNKKLPGYVHCPKDRNEFVSSELLEGNLTDLMESGRSFIILSNEKQMIGIRDELELNNFEVLTYPQCVEGLNPQVVLKTFYGGAGMNQVGMIIFLVIFLNKFLFA